MPLLLPKAFIIASGRVLGVMHSPRSKEGTKSKLFIINEGKVGSWSGVFSHVRESRRHSSSSNYFVIKMSVVSAGLLIFLVVFIPLEEFKHSVKSVLLSIIQLLSWAPQLKWITLPSSTQWVWWEDELFIG
jgi:hypothetical protein